MPDLAIHGIGGTRTAVALAGRWAGGSKSEVDSGRDYLEKKEKIRKKLEN
jgi:hypothetical protein